MRNQRSAFSPDGPAGRPLYQPEHTAALSAMKTTWPQPNRTVRYRACSSPLATVWTAPGSPPQTPISIIISLERSENTATARPTWRRAASRASAPPLASPKMK
eukprot:369842-Pyramimonas_sp.AAC.1